MRSPDVIVIGAGVVGLFTALELARSGLRVQILERDRAGQQSSWAGGGILSPLHPWRYPASVQALSTWAQRQYPEISESLAESTGVDPEWVRSGMLLLEPEEATAAMQWAKIAGESCERLASDAVRKLEPECGLDTGGIYLPNVAQIRNPRLLKALAIQAKNLGIVINESVNACQLVHENGKVTAVGDGVELWSAGAVVIASGAWSSGILKPLGASPLIRPVKGQMLLFEGAVNMLRTILLEREHYLIPRRDGRIVVGSTVEDAGFDVTPTEAARTELTVAAYRLLPALASCRIESHWAGLRPGSADGVPYVCRHPEIEGLYINAGHFRHGILTAPATARLLGDLLLSRPAGFDPTPYGWAR